MVKRLNPSECFDYNPETGSLIWKHRPREHFNSDRGWKSFNSRCAGKSALVRHSAGYWQCGRADLIGSSTLAHRIIWEMVKGSIPSGMQVDHINNNRMDNRLCNLRLATGSQNQHNRPKNKNSPYKGCNYDKRRKRWYSRISANRMTYNLGYFKTPEEAHAAYCEAAKALHGEFARLT